ncbi:MAG: LysR family transcriptional regulator [Planctomycetes bacterium]|nr:LysR family transcriptional regulator [Planctomycetota bacterium]
MDWLNYHHLRYFWTVAKEGSIARASQVLHVSQPSISSQLRLLEQALGEKLLQKHGRGLQLTEMGRMVLVYAEQIFALGKELLDAVHDRPTGQPLRLQIGIVDVMPKILAFRLLEPVFALDTPVRLIVREDRPERLLAELANYELDLVITDTPHTGGGRVRTWQHPLGHSEISVFGSGKLAKAARAAFPQSLGGLPVLLPTEHGELRRDVDDWQRRHDLRLHVVGEFEDSALLKTFAQHGRGLMFAPTVLTADLKEQHGLLPCGLLDGAHIRYWAITVERKVRHAAVAAILVAARAGLFGHAPAVGRH